MQLIWLKRCEFEKKVFGKLEFKKNKKFNILNLKSKQLASDFGFNRI